MVASKANTWVWLEQSYVQILVVVATIQMRTLKTDVEKGSMWTAIGHGSVSPKMRSKEGSECGIFIFYRTYSNKSKGKQVNILVLSVGDCLFSTTNICGNTNKLKYITSGPGKSFLFFVTSSDDPGISSTGDRVQMKVKSNRSCYFLGASFVILENLSKIINFALICTLNRIRSPRWKASSQLEQGSTREVGKIDRQLRDNDWL